MNITDLVKQAHRIAVEHGFWEHFPATNAKDLATCLALIHSEVSEALEELRAGRPMDEELADVVIRVADLCGALGIDLDTAVTVKMALNKTRPRKHGKAF